MRASVRVRHLLARRPWLYWLAVAVVAAAAGAVVANAMAAVAEQRRAWGTPQRVVVATRDAEAGEPVGLVAAIASWPAPMLPPSAVRVVDPAAVLRRPVADGEVIVADDIAATAGPQALIPPGWLGVPVPEAVPSGVVTGALVTVISGGIVLATDAVIAGTLTEGVLVAVPSADAPLVAQAATTGDVVISLQP
jgi:hypothetical protein